MCTLICLCLQYTIDIKRRNNNNLLRTDILPALTGIISDIETKHEVCCPSISFVFISQFHSGSTGAYRSTIRTLRK
jgi:hypothetical protein